LNIANTQKNRGAGQLARYLHSRYPGAKFFSAYEAGFCGTSAHHDLCKVGIHNMIIHPADLPQTDKQKKTRPRADGKVSKAIQFGRLNHGGEIEILINTIRYFSRIAIAVIHPN